MTKITQLLGSQSATNFDELYELRSKFVHEGQRRGHFGEAASRAYDLALALLLADIDSSSRQGNERPTTIEPFTGEDSEFEPAIGAESKSDLATEEGEAMKIAGELNARNEDQSIRYKASKICSGWAVEIQERRCYWGHRGYFLMRAAAKQPPLPSRNTLRGPSN